jgi:hypothetical protein
LSEFLLFFPLLIIIPRLLSNNISLLHEAWDTPDQSALCHILGLLIWSFGCVTRHFAGYKVRRVVLTGGGCCSLDMNVS